MEQRDSIASQRPRSPPQARRILVADDMEDSREVLARFLELQGHTVCTASDGLEGLIAASKFRPEIVFLDLAMPRMDGFELCARLRANHLTKDAAVFAVTGRSNDRDRFSRMEGGFDAYLYKPIECEVVERLIQSAGSAPRSQPVIARMPVCPLGLRS